MITRRRFLGGGPFGKLHEVLHRATHLTSRWLSGWEPPSGSYTCCILKLLHVLQLQAAARTAISNCYMYCNFKLIHTATSNCYTDYSFKLLPVLQIQIVIHTAISNCYTYCNFKLLHTQHLQTVTHTATSNCYTDYSFKLLQVLQPQLLYVPELQSPTSTRSSRWQTYWKFKVTDVLEVQGDTRTRHSRYCNYWNLNEGAIRIPTTR